MPSVVIVDDEPKSRESVRILLEDFCENVQVRALCGDVAEGIQSVLLHRPDVVFLDVQLQRETGFDLLTKIDRVDFEVIFTTAHAGYAIKAFKFSAIDYLLKPIDIAELKRALEKVGKKMNGNIGLRLDSLIQNLRPSHQIQKIALPAFDGLVFVKIADIVYCEASGNYTRVFLSSGLQYPVARTLKEYEEMLKEFNFFRANGSFLVNLAYVDKHSSGDGGQLVLSTGATLVVSKRRSNLSGRS